MGEQCPCGYRYECPCGCQACPRCGPDPAARSRVSGAIGRGLADAAAGYRRQLATLADHGPGDD
jgi:hypothetical protein